MKLSNTDVINGIVSNNRRVLNEVYLHYLPMVTRLVVSNNGNESEALDVFQDGLVVLFEKLKTVQHPDQIKCAAYLTGVCKNIWLMKIRRKKMGSQKEQSVAEVNGDLDKELWDDMIQSQRYELYRSHFDKLGTDCQKVLSLFLQKTSLRMIAEQMGFTEQYAKKRKYKCQKKLIASIESDQLYNELVNY